MPTRLNFAGEAPSRATTEDSAKPQPSGPLRLSRWQWKLRVGSATLTKASCTGDIVTGRGFAYAYRGQTIAAQVAEVEVNRRTGTSG